VRTRSLNQASTPRLTSTPKNRATITAGRHGGHREQADEAQVQPGAGVAGPGVDQVQQPPADDAGDAEDQGQVEAQHRQDDRGGRPDRAGGRRRRGQGHGRGGQGDGQAIGPAERVARPQQFAPPGPAEPGRRSFKLQHGWNGRH
jgi:hypothetical protein